MYMHVIEICNRSNNKYIYIYILYQQYRAKLKENYIGTINNYRLSYICIYIVNINNIVLFNFALLCSKSL